jgi:hypothetical protein
MGYRGLLAGSALLMMACSASGNPLEPERASVRVLSDHSVDISGVVSAECLDEDIAISGVMQVKESSFEDGNGGFHLNSHTSLVVTGVGMTSGAVYHGAGTDFVSGHLKRARRLRSTP